VSGAKEAGSEDPQVVYSHRLLDRSSRTERLRARDARISRARLALFGIGVATAFASLGSGWLSWVWLALPGAGFLALLPWHERVIRARDRAQRAVTFYERGLARLDHRFAGTGSSGEEFRDPAHPYADDLDLFGKGSLFELLCLARTRAGEARLAGWLKEPTGPAQVRARQAAAQELRPRLDLREDLALLGREVRAGLRPEALRAWGEAPAAGFHAGHRLLAPALAAFAVGSLALWIATPAGPVPFAIALAMQGIFAARLRRRVQAVVRSVETPTRELELFSLILARLEAESFQAPRLATLRRSLETRGLAPSREIQRLRRRVELLDARRNQLFAPLGALLLWTTQLAMTIDVWRTALGPSLGAWLDAVGEIEALGSLAGYAYEHPDHPFPDLVEEGALFDGEALGHPLLHPQACVRNDVRLGADLQVFVVSGSNMSGKSTLLRTVGVNAVLAQAGAPVCAARLRLSPLHLAASIRVVDSLQEGESRFYAELKRVRAVTSLAETHPTLFLLDELFAGTNSHDRRIGAEAVVRALIARGAIGLVTTHDLALARVADALAPAAANVHFEDHLEEGRMAFDYRMHPGMVRKSNAVALMRAVGLPV